MIISIVLIITFIVGFAFGLAMPFILFKFPFTLNKGTIEKKDPASTANEILDEWLNGK